MADKANIVSYMDNATTSVTLKPYSSSKDEEKWIDSASDIEQRFKKVCQFSRQFAKDGTERRLIKVSNPVTKLINSISSGVIDTNATLNFDITPYIVVPVPPGATDADIASALKMLINTVMGDATAGTANAFLNAADQGRDFLIHGFLPD